MTATKILSAVMEAYKQIFTDICTDSDGPAFEEFDSTTMMRLTKALMNAARAAAGQAGLKTHLQANNDCSYGQAA
jgi:hypothetical protein